MKKVFLAAATAALALGMSSCYQKEYEAAKFSLDSLEQAKQQLEKQYDDEQKLIAEVEENFDAIKEAQLGLAKETQTSEGINPNKKEQLKENFRLLNDKFEENKQKIADLEQKLQASNSRFGALQATISRLKKQQSQFQEEITSLKGELEKKNVEIQDLNQQIAVRDAQRDSVDRVAAERAATMQAQDEALNTAYYLIANKKTLKTKGYKQSKLSSADTKEGDFTKIDIRTFAANEGMDLNSKKAELYTQHPASSYSLTQKDKTTIFKIKDPKAFWKNSKYLIIEVK